MSINSRYARIASTYVRRWPFAVIAVVLLGYFTLLYYGYLPAAHVAEQAKLGKDYDVRVIPEPKNFIQKLMEEGGAGAQDTSHVRANTTLLDMARPFLQQLDPSRVASVERALRALDPMRTETVIMWMPEATR
ncbi:MAG: hypothetical protein M3478_01215 [Planctomycetota bacterium]|nr:hypothetical protein [Planctomycetota bacterium]